LRRFRREDTVLAGEAEEAEEEDDDDDGGETNDPADDEVGVGGPNKSIKSYHWGCRRRCSVMVGSVNNCVVFCQCVVVVAAVR
jgi:hypothetical protein